MLIIIGGIAFSTFMLFFLLLEFLLYFNIIKIRKEKLWFVIASTCGIGVILSTLVIFGSFVATIIKI